MAKKQQIILTHGTGVPALENVKLGEVLVRHASDAKDAALYTPNNAENAFIEFPSKEWVTAEVAAVNADGINKTVAALQTQVDGIDAAYKAADKAEKEAREDAVKQLQKDYEQADTVLENTLTAAFEGADAGLKAEIDAIDGRVSTLEETVPTNLQTAKDYADEKVTALANGAVAANTAAIAKEAQDRATAVSNEKATRKAADEALQAAIDLKVSQTEYNGKVAAIEGNIDAIESVLAGYTTEGSVKAAVDSKVAQSEYDTKVAAIESSIKAIDEVITALDDTYVDNDELDAAKTELTGAIAKAKTTLTEANPATGIVVTKTANDPNNYEITYAGLATTGEMNAVVARLEVIEGEANVDGSMKNIAAAEVAKVIANAPEDFDTLKEIADWIGSDTTGAAEMATDISNLKSTLAGFDTTNTVKKTTDAIDGRVSTIEGDYLKAADKTALEGKITEEATARENADKAIDAKFGDGISSTNTVSQVVAKEVQDRKDAVQGIQNQIDALDNTYAKDSELAGVKSELEGKIAKAKTTLIAASPTAGVKVVESSTDPNVYTVEAVGLAAQLTVTAIDGRLTTAEGEIDALKAADTAMEAAYKAADEVVIAAYKAADTALETKLNGEIAKKADQTTVNGIDTRLAAVEGVYVKQITYKDADGTTVTLDAVGNVIDLSGLVIDGGTY